MAYRHTCKTYRKSDLSKESTRNYLIAYNVIDENNTILSKEDFDSAVTFLTEEAKKKFPFVSTQLVSEMDGKAIFQLDVFHQIDASKGIRYNENRYLFSDPGTPEEPSEIDLLAKELIDIKNKNAEQESKDEVVLGSVADEILTPTIKPGVPELFESNPELASISTPEQYSQYLDLIFSNSKVEEIDDSLYNSVLNQLEQENIIEKDCNGVGKLKAEKGLQTNFTKGGKWKIYEIFEGKSHKQGGIDINIKNNQISFTNKNGSIKAKYGLVISKDN